MRKWLASVWDAVMRVFTRIVIAYWAKREPSPPLPRRYSESPSDNVQQTMNLIMPLAHPGPKTTSELMALMRNRVDDLFVGLDLVGTVHFARFDVIDDELSMLSVYDGDFETYIRDFIVAFGDVFDALMTFVKDPPEFSVAERPSDFVDWVNERDLLQVPDDPTILVDDLELLPRRLLVMFKETPNVQLGIYRGYAGYSVAQIRQALGLEWGGTR